MSDIIDDIFGVSEDTAEENISVQSDDEDVSPQLDTTLTSKSVDFIEGPESEADRIQNGQFYFANDSGNIHLNGKTYGPLDTTIAQKLNKLMKKNFPVIVSFNSNWDIKEYTGSNQSITLSWSITEDEASVTPTSLEVKNGSSKINTTLSASGSVSSTVSSLGTTTFTISATANETNVSGSKSVELVRAMYFGFTNSTTLSDATTLTKQTIKSSPSGTYTLSHTGTEYMWLCVGSNKSINKVSSSGFDVPMESAVTVGSYKCYRSSNTMTAGSITFTIS